MKKKTLMGLLLAGCLAAMPAGVYAEEAAEAETTEVAEGLSEELYDFQAEINGVLYQFPMTYEEFVANGWTPGKNEDPDMMIASNSYGSVTFYRGEDSVYADVFNLGINELPMKECLIGGIDIEGGSYGVNLEKTTVNFAKGISMGASNVEDIKAAYGEPTDTYDSDLYTKLTYSSDIYEEVCFYVYKDDNTLKEIDLRNFVEPEGFDKGSVSTETPEIVSAYTAPTEMGEDFMSPVVEYCGDLYQLPAPVTAFIANGWQMKDVADEDYVSGGNIAFIDMSKDNQTVHFSVYNHTPNAVTVENCFVEELEVGTYDPEAITLKLSGDMTLGANKADLIAIAEEKGYFCEEDGSYLNICKTKDTMIDNRAQFWFNEDENPDIVASVTYRNTED